MAKRLLGRLWLLAVGMIMAGVLLHPFAGMQARAQAQGQPPSGRACMRGIGDMRPNCNVSGLQLTASSTDRVGLIDQFGTRRLHMAQALQATGAYMQKGSCGQTRVDLPMAHSYCWPGAYQTGNWMPQGITGDGESGWDDMSGRNLTLVSWYYNNKASSKHSITRVSMIDNETARFVTVRLVEPKVGKHPGCTYRNGVSLCHLVSHAGGLAWSGQYLYVAGTNRIHVFDLSHFLHVGNRYVLPEVGRYTEASEGAFRISFISVDVSRHELITGTFDPSATTEQIIHWPLHTDSSAIQTTAAYAATTRGVAFSTHLQGAAVQDGHYFLAQSGGAQAGNTLYSVPPNGRAQAYRWVYGTEDLYLDTKRNMLWGAGEFAGNRSVVGVDVSSYL